MSTTRGPLIAFSIEAPWRALEELALLLGAHELASVDHMLAAREHMRDRAADRLSFIRIIFRGRVMGLCRYRMLFFGIGEHDIRVRARREMALARVEPEELGRGRGGDVHEAVRGELALGDRVP